MGQLDAALGDFTAALKLKPNDLTALTDRGAILIEQRDFPPTHATPALTR
jgi:regulator of sirC expression with transglutaminase-like and TPR domain